MKAVAMVGPLEREKAGAGELAGEASANGMLVPAGGCGAKGAGTGVAPGAVMKTEGPCVRLFR